MGSARFEHALRPAGRPGAAVHSTAACRVRASSRPWRRAYSKGHDVVTRLVSKDPTQCTWPRQRRQGCAVSPAPGRPQMRPQAPRSAPAHCGHATRAQVRAVGLGRAEPDLRAGGLAPWAEGGEAGWAGAGCGDPCIQEGPREAAGAAPLQGGAK